MLTDSDLSSTRHARAFAGGALAGLTGLTELFVSGGAEHQGPDGGGPVAIIATRRSRRHAMSAMPSTAAAAARAGRAIALSAQGMTKRFGAFTALDQCSIESRPAQFHVLLGENGAGKSTLVKCIMGFYQPDEGTLAVDGRPVTVRNPRDARALGIGMVYQQFTLVPSLTGAENLVISRADAPAVIDWRREKARARRLHGPHAVPGRRSTSRSRRWRPARSRSSRSSSCSTSTSTSSSWTSPPPC